MTDPVSERRGNAIILQGSFNPQILQPAWFAGQGLIREAESETADINIVHSEIVAFELDWMHFQVDRDQLTIRSTAKTETPEQVRDLVIGLGQILDHTPIHLVSIEFFAHYALADKAQRDALGWKLVPPDPFKKHLKSAGMRTLKMVGRRTSEETGNNGVITTIEPSAAIEPNGVFISVMDQYELGDPAEPNVGSGPAIDCLKTNWQHSLDRAKAIPADVFSLI
ncbi:MAG TPA: hypothetical protein VEQ41_02660 [Solirubrobacterales bacterium]|nr:hypothetical protein [Solirubrobacterales bacterium]